MRKYFTPDAGALVRLEQVEDSGETFTLEFGDKYFTPVQAAYIIGCSTRTLATMTGKRIGYSTFGHHGVRYSKTNLMDYLSGALIPDTVMV